jgi:hypothetical protein
MTPITSSIAFQVATGDRERRWHGPLDEGPRPDTCSKASPLRPVFAAGQRHRWQQLADQ